MMNICVKNEQTSIVLQAHYNDSVADVKAAYVATGKCPRGKQGYIVLLFKGKELQDEELLGEKGVVNDSVLIHVEIDNVPFRGIDYRLQADELKRKRQHQAELLRKMQHEDIWTTDEQGRLRYLGPDKSIISKMPASTNFGQSSSSRSFSNDISVRIGGSRFHLLPRMEGRWNGEMTTVPSDIGSQVCSSELLFREDDSVWTHREMQTSINGMTSAQHFWLKPVADGILKVETDTPTLRACDITMQETGSNIMILTAVSKASGKPILVETVTLIDTARRLRTVQKFDESGAFRYVVVMHEQRVVDAVSGAMQKYNALNSRV